MGDTWVRSRDIQRAYQEGRAGPEAVTRACLAAIADSQRAEIPLSAFVVVTEDVAMAAARASAERHRRGAALGPLDGIPVAIKDMIDLADYPTTDGTTFRGEVAHRDGELVRRLKAAGAIIVGKTALHEIGLGGTGINPGHITARNPRDRSRATGGSSSGSGAAVAAGLVPVALGSDAGGSIRIPAAFCGVFGLKPTFGRVPSSGCALLAWTLDALGPLGACVEDLGAFYQVVAGPDPGDASSLGQPSPEAAVSLGPDGLRGLRVAWCPDFADDADPPVRAAFHKALEALRLAGARVEEVSVEGLEYVGPVGYLTIGAEGAASQRDWLRHHRAEYGNDTRLLLAMGETVSAVEYLHAQRVRSLITRSFRGVLERYDVFASPTTACVAPKITAAALATGEVDDAVNSATSRYTFAANLTGFPALSLPAPVEPGALPVGLQLMCLPWEEGRLLGIGAAVEALLPPVPPPPGYVDLLGRAAR